eukprot:5660440-Prymnesium_polylepis.1
MKPSELASAIASSCPRARHGMREIPHGHAVRAVAAVRCFRQCVRRGSVRWPPTPASSRCRSGQAPKCRAAA